MTTCFVCCTIITMKQLNLETISATYYIGSEVILSPSWHDKNVILPNSKLFYILDGEISLEYHDKTITAKGGDMVLIPAGVKHSFNLTKKGFAKKCWFHFDLTVNGNNFFDSFTLPYKIKIGFISQVKDAFDRIFSLANANTPESKLKINADLFFLISFYLERCNYIQNENTAKDEIDRVVLYIKNHHCENLSLSDLAKHVNLSPNYLIRKFKERTGYSPLQYATVLKIEKAKYLIEQSNSSIGQIMEELGFLDASHFSKLFKKYCGYSPKKYREISGK